MNNRISKSNIAASIWFLTCAVFALGWLMYAIIFDTSLVIYCIIAFVFSILCSVPVFIILILTLPWIDQRKDIEQKTKLQLLYLVCFISTMPYAVLYGLINSDSNDWLTNFIYHTLLASLALFLCSLIAISIIHKSINNYFSSSQINNFMEQNQFQDATNFGNTNQDSNINPSTDWKRQKTRIKQFKQNPF